MFYRPFTYPNYVSFYNLPYRYYSNINSINQRIQNYGYMNDVQQNAIITQDYEPHHDIIEPLDINEI